MSSNEGTYHVHPDQMDRSPDARSRLAGNQRCSAGGGSKLFIRNTRSEHTNRPALPFLLQPRPELQSRTQLLLATLQQLPLLLNQPVPSQLWILWLSSRPDLRIRKSLQRDSSLLRLPHRPAPPPRSAPLRSPNKAISRINEPRPRQTSQFWRGFFTAPARAD